MGQGFGSNVGKMLWVLGKPSPLAVEGTFNGPRTSHEQGYQRGEGVGGFGKHYIGGTTPYHCEGFWAELTRRCESLVCSWGEQHDMV